jgi:hypothetical protein
VIQKEKNGKYRVRYDFGHNKYYRFLLKKEIKIEKKLESLNQAIRKKPVEEKLILKELESIKKEILVLENKFGKPVNIKTRRSFNCRNQWQAEYAEKLFKDAHDHEAEGKEIPDYLEKAIESLQDAPFRQDFLQELGYQLASVSGLVPEVIFEFDYNLFLSQADINLIWLENFQIAPNEVKKAALAICSDQETIELKDKTFLFTGSFMSFTACEDYIKCLHKLAKEVSADGIIVIGPWTKYIFLHKTAQQQKVMNAVKKLAEDNIKIYAIRSNIESADLIPNLKELGITFLTKIEDENNLFLSHKFSRSPRKDELIRFRDYSINKNLFVHTSYVAFEPVLRKENVRYIVGSGSSSFFTPSSRIWANSYDGQRINAEKYSNIGGHILRFDKKGDVFPSSFFYNMKSKSICVNGLAYPVKGDKEDALLHVMISDVHSKIMDRKAFNGFLHFLDKNKQKIKSLSINGDFFDNIMLCHHNENNISAQIKDKIAHKSFLHEIAQARYVLELIVNKLKPDVQLYFKMGNHEVNSIKRILQKPLLHFLDTLLDMDTLLGLSKMGFEIIDARKPYYVGEIPIFHGHEMHRNKATRIHGSDNVSGHSHRGTIDNNGTILPTFQSCESATYLNYAHEPWTTGWAVLHEYKGYVSRPELILIQKDSFFDFDTIYKIKNDFVENIPKELTIKFNLD